MSISNITSIKDYLLNLQNTICEALENIDGFAKFQRDQWERSNGGGEGQTHVLSEGAVIEKCGVNFSHVRGEQLPVSATKQRPGLINSPFEAMGISLIVHPQNPFAPTAHFNLRFLISYNSQNETVWWFGGGFDLTPYYGFVEDCEHWHNTARQACAPFGESVYPQYKKQADDYFYLQHRKEPRGIGGIFFDDLNHWDFTTCFAFTRSVGDHFLPAYLPILSRRKDHAFHQKQRDFQCYRRGRYVEFNLLYDRGTLFGLQSGGRTESILISLPPQVSWHYNWHPEPGSPEARLHEEFLAPREWSISC